MAQNRVSRFHGFAFNNIGGCGNLYGSKGSFEEIIRIFVSLQAVPISGINK